VLELTGRRRSFPDSIVRPITDATVEPHFAEFVRSVYSADVKVSAVELVGDVVDAVVDYARSASADLVVVADQARSHGPYWRRGVYASDLSRHLSIPLVPFRSATNGSHTKAPLLKKRNRTLKQLRASSGRARWQRHQVTLRVEPSSVLERLARAL
jgi:hypothetical protein